MITSSVDMKAEVSKVILNMEKPFKLSQLYAVLADRGIENKLLILDVLNQLYEKGLVDRTDVEDDTTEYKSNLSK